MNRDKLVEEMFNRFNNVMAVETALVTLVRRGDFAYRDNRKIVIRI